MNCRICKTEMVFGTALVNTPAYGIEDFAGDERGQTFSMSGAAVAVKVMKCPNCGHSVGVGADEVDDANR